MKNVLAAVVALSLMFTWTAPAQSGSREPAPAAQPSKALVDINAASQAQLQELPGIGPTLARKIIKGRPYKSKDELVRRNVIPQSAYAPIRTRVVAHQK